MSDVKNILLAGVGGQGIILASKILAAGLIQAGYDVKMSEVHGMAQRGELDESLIKFFFEHDVFKQYAHEELKIEQLDSL